MCLESDTTQAGVSLLESSLNKFFRPCKLTCRHICKSGVFFFTNLEIDPFLPLQWGNKINYCINTI